MRSVPRFCMRCMSRLKWCSRLIFSMTALSPGLDIIHPMWHMFSYACPIQNLETFSGLFHWECVDHRRAYISFNIDSRTGSSSGSSYRELFLYEIPSLPKLSRFLLSFLDLSSCYQPVNHSTVRLKPSTRRTLRRTG